MVALLTEHRIVCSAAGHTACRPLGHSATTHVMVTHCWVILSVGLGNSSVGHSITAHSTVTHQWLTLLTGLGNSPAGHFITTQKTATHQWFALCHMHQSVCLYAW